MARKLVSSQHYLLSPSAEGWQLCQASLTANADSPQSFSTMQEAAEAIPAGSRVQLALPLRMVFFERLTLFSGEDDELGAMMRLQLEKTLPYPAEETSSAFVVIEKKEKESLVLALAAHTAQIDELCAPLRERQSLPEKITPYAMQVAAVCAADEPVFFVYREETQYVMAVSENGKLVFAQSIAADSPEEAAARLPQVILGMEINGVATKFKHINLEEKCAALEPEFHKLFEETPVERFSLAKPVPEVKCNLAPTAWRDERRKAKRQGTMKKRLIQAAAVYVILIICGWIYSWSLQRKVVGMDKQIAATQTEVESLQAAKKRWKAFAPAINPKLSIVEMMLQITKQLPSDSMHITGFNLAGETQIKIIAEAPTAPLATSFYQRLKKSAELKEMHFQAGAPQQLSANSHWQITIYGKQ